jgi:hypothetical protein
MYELYVSVHNVRRREIKRGVIISCVVSISIAFIYISLNHLVHEGRDKRKIRPKCLVKYKDTTASGTNSLFLWTFI